MADPIADNADFAVDELKRKARRRLVGAIVLALAAATLLPLLLEQDQKPLGEDVSIQIPPVDNGKFVSRLTPDKGKDTAAEPKGDSGTIKIASKANDQAAAPGAKPNSNADPKSEARPPVPMETKADAKAAPAEMKSDPKATPKAETKVDAKADATVAPKAETAAGVPAEATADVKSAPVAGMTSAPSTADAPATTPQGPVDPDKVEGFVVQLGAFTDNYGANALANKLKKIGYPAYTESVDTSRGKLWRVRVGGYPSRQAAAEARTKLKGDGQNGIVVAAK